MEHAKKLVLIEPRILEELRRHREYKELQKPCDKKRQTTLSLQMRDVLADNRIADDLKAKRYREAFKKFQSIGNVVPAPETAASPITGNVYAAAPEAPKKRRRRSAKTRTWLQY